MIRRLAHLCFVTDDLERLVGPRARRRPPRRPGRPAPLAPALRHPRRSCRARCRRLGTLGKI